MELISAVIITKNEEKNIGRCLDSLFGIVDEIVVIDSLSTDNTKGICEQYGALFFEKEFVNYSDSKNFGNSKASNDIILSLDADEVISETLKASILKTKQDFTADGYAFNRLTNYCGHWVRYCGWYPDTKLRLFRKSKAEWKGEIHETVHLFSGSPAKLKGDLLHYSYPNIQLHASKTNHFTNMAAKEMFENGRKVGVFKLLFGPLVEFIKKFFFQKGFMDGYYGFVISVMSAYYNFFKYAKLKNLWLNKKD